MLMEMSTMVTGRRTKLMVMESTVTKMAPNTMENGKKICSTAKVLRLGLTDHRTKETTSMARSMALESTLVPMVALSQVNGPITS